MNENSELKVIQLNINSIISLAKRTEFEIFIKQNTPHIVLLSETKLNKVHKLNINGYTTLRNDRTKNKGGGTAILYTENLKCEQIQTPKNITSFECCICKLSLHNGKNIIIASIYKPPTEIVNKNPKLIKIIPHELNNIFSLDKNAYYLIGGDFNSKHTDWNNNTNCTNGKIISNWYETHKHIYNISIYTAKNPTCMRSSTGSHIDFGFISSELNLTDTANKKQLKSELFSDHSAIFIPIQITPQKQETTYIKNYRKARWSLIKKYVESEISKINIPTEKNLNRQEIDFYIHEINNI